MVHVGSIKRALLIAVVAVTACAGVHAQDAPVEVAIDAQQAEVESVTKPIIEKTTCVSQEVVTEYENRVDALEAERKNWEKQLVSASRAWQTEKAELEGKIAEERVLQMVAAAEMTNLQKEAAFKVGTIERQLEESREQHQKALDELKKQVAALETTVGTLKQQLADQTESLGEKDNEVVEAKARLAKYSDQVKSLERDVVQSNKKNDVLLKELNKAEDRLTIAALLSSYYDEGVDLAERAVMALRSQVDSVSTDSSTLADSLAALEEYKKTTTQVTEKLYKEHLAATIDPLIVELRRVTDPYIAHVQPLAEAEFKRAQKAVLQAYKQALKRGRAARADAIALVKANDSVAPYAQQLVDGSLLVLAFPFVVIALRIVLSLVWFMIRTVLCVVTLGFCCGKCSRKRSKTKRKASRKPLSAAAQAAAATPSLTPTKKQQSPPSTGRRTAGGKKK